MRRRVVVAGGAVVALLAGGGAVVAAAGTPAAVHREDRFLEVSEGVRIDTSFFTAGGSGRRPAILLAHGFGGSKESERSRAEELARDGYAVLTWSARGFGQSSGQIGLNEPEREVADVSRLVDWLAQRPEVQLDGEGDPRVGVTGASYGGAVSLLAAAYDKRIDAIAPQITWWNLADALFPQAAQGSSAVAATPVARPAPPLWRRSSCPPRTCPTSARAAARAVRAAGRRCSARPASARGR